MKLQVDSPVIQAGIKVTNLLILNLYWILGCVPLVTIGTSTIAAYTVCERLAEDRESVSMTRQFWDAYKANLWHGIVLTLIFAAAGYAAWMNWQLFDKLDGNPMGFLFLSIVLIILILAHGLYVFALEARYENRLSSALNNSRRIFLRFFPRTLGLVGILFIQYLLFFQTTYALVFVGIFLAPILAIYTTSQMAMPIFRKLEDDGLAQDALTVSGEQD